MKMDNDDNNIEENSESGEDVQEAQDTEEGVDSEKGTGRRWLKVAIKVSLIVGVFLVVFYLIYFSTRYGKATLTLSNREIASVGQSIALERTFPAGSRIYFHIERENRRLESTLFVIAIEYFENNSYRHYKQITYEIDEDFPKVSASIPEEYFMRAGQYRIKALLDSKIVDTKEIEVIGEKTRQ